MTNFQSCLQMASVDDAPRKVDEAMPVFIPCAPLKYFKKYKSLVIV